MSVTRKLRREAIWRTRIDGVLWTCDLVNHGEWGIEAQILQDRELFVGRRFLARGAAVA